MKRRSASVHLRVVRHKSVGGAGLMFALFASLSWASAESPTAKLGCYISTGDNHWLGESLPVDSRASIEASFDLLARLGVRRVYWRGLEEATWVDTMQVREENCRYASAFHWFTQLSREVHPDRVAVEAAHRRGMEIWGVGTLVDWGGAADAPNFGDFPGGFESRLRLEHPEWVPVDRSGLLRQAGPIEFAYPQAREALVDLHMKHVRQDGYDGVLLISYAENYSMRFQDEFGYSDPIVRQFQRRTKVDLRTQPFTRQGSRYDWYALRGEYLTQYLRQLKAELRRDGRKLGIFVNPQQPHFTQPWNVPELMLTAGHVYCDLETWVREGIVDHLLVYGYCNPPIQNRTVDDCLWMTRATPCTVGALTSSPFADRWTPYAKQGLLIAASWGEDASYLDRSLIRQQPLSALGSQDSLLRMRVLAQIIYGKSKASTQQVAPLVHDQNPLVRRMALAALGRLKDPTAVPLIEEGLADPENCVRCAAGLALRDNHRPQSAAKMLAAVERFGNHPLVEVVFKALPALRPLPRAELSQAATKHVSALVRSTAMRALALMPDKTLLSVYAAGLRDSDRFVRFAAAQGLGGVHHSAQAVEILLEALPHEDPVTADRAAKSLGLLSATGEQETVPLRPQVIAGLRQLYAKFGDGCRRVDAAWGYRPVGNALLKLGPEGEKILQGFMDQRQDHRLALQAWKSLYIRQDNNTFSEVTEKENEQAFEHLPKFALESAPPATVPRPAAPVVTPPAPGRHWYVNPDTGDDRHNGLAPAASDSKGPLRTIARAIRLAGPGDTIDLAKAVYHEPIGFYGKKSGASGRPITVDGHDAVICGSAPLAPRDWQQVGPGLYRNATLFRTVLHSSWEFVARFSFIFDGKLQRMSHSVKAPKVPWKTPAELQPGQWTYRQDDADAYYIKIDPAKALADYRIEVPVMVSGVQIDGSIAHLVFKNLTVTHVINDGFALRTSPPGGKVYDIRYENIRAVDNCDDGFSAHGDCEVQLDGFYCEGCSTGIATSGTSVNNHVVTRNIHGVDLLFGQGKHVVTDSRIEGHGATAGILAETWNAYSPELCDLKLENVVVGGALGQAGPARLIRVIGRPTRLTLVHATLCGMSIRAEKGATLAVHDSVVAGGSSATIDVQPDVTWQADRNVYDVKLIRTGATAYAAGDFSALQKNTAQDRASRFNRIQFRLPFDGSIESPPIDRGIGADLSRLPRP
jgi:hypothetical protein